MEPIPSYNLLQAIDPTKIKVPISERFAKLTLSSNKKQQQKCDEQQFKIQKEKRDSVARNISKQFENEIQEPETSAQNPLLLSESSKETELNNCLDAHIAAEDLTMEPLEISEDIEQNKTEQQAGDDIHLLSQQMASMAVDAKTISVSSGSTCNLSVFNDLISSESQPSSINEADKIHIVHHIPIVVKEAVKQETILLNLTSNSNENSAKSCELTEDEEENVTYDEADEAITISDSSNSHHEPEQDIMITSSLASTSLTAEHLYLPSLVADKAERVAAFLRDVSQEHIAMNEQGQLVLNDTVDRILDKKEIDKIQETISKARQIATADTESMTPDVGEEVTPKHVVDRERRLNALGEFEAVQEQPKNIYVNKIVNNEPQKTLKPCSPKTPKAGPIDVYDLANDETQCNTDFTLRRGDFYSEPLFNESSQSVNKEILHSGRLANDDTVANSVISNIDDCDTPVIAKTRNYSLVSVDSTLISRIDTNSNENTCGSVLNSSNEGVNDTVPEASITISETDNEDSRAEESSYPNKDISDDKKLSNSFHREESSDDSEYEQQMSKIQMSLASINISAKINIKIHIPKNTFSSEDDQNVEPHATDHEEMGTKQSKQLTDQTNEQSHKSASNIKDNGSGSNDRAKDKKTKDLRNEKSYDKNHSYRRNNQSVLSATPQKQEPYKQIQTKKPKEKIASSTNRYADSSSEEVEDEKFLTEAEKLLTQLYGKSWQTPDVIRTLKRSSQSADKKAKSSARKKIDTKNSKDEISDKRSLVEDNVLDDFSMFRRNIVRTNLNSTRLATPKSTMPQKLETLTEPRNTKQPLGQPLFDLHSRPETEQKPKTTPVTKTIKNKRNAACNDRWRHLIDNESNSEGDNASDDDDADKSWSKNASELEDNSSDSDYEIPSRSKNPRDKNHTTKRQGRSDKSDRLTKTLNKSKNGEIVYLDLSKDEVEVQEEIPASPPVNHDLTFASRLQDILRTCRHENKVILPSSSSSKSKRKLFTPRYDDDDYESSKTKDDEKKHTDAEKENHGDSDYTILQDNGHCPFDSFGRPKVFELVNKQLESVKTGQRNFLLTPSPKKKSTKLDMVTPTTKASAKPNEAAQFKTPSTVVKSNKTQQTKTALKDLFLIPDYKYSFLKSLDVTVSRTLCHPDALYYRNNFRTKKEELSKILYDMYNEKLFDNKLEVPLLWNKKLLNTAGRCLNKKKLGIRSSVVELSDKVLTSADRLRCTLIHELCHAATWIYNGEGGHGSTWKQWACKANAIFPDIPKIGVCHQYDIEYKYTYKCTLCAAKSYAHSKSKKVENIRCSYCHGAIEVFLNKKDKDGNVIPTPVKEATGFAKFVKDNYKKFKSNDLKHADVMKLLSNEFASLKVTNN